MDNDKTFLKKDRAISVLKDVKFELTYILEKKDELSKQDIIMNIHSLVTAIKEAI